MKKQNHIISGLPPWPFVYDSRTGKRYPVVAYDPEAQELICDWPELYKPDDWNSYPQFKPSKVGNYLAKVDTGLMLLSNPPKPDIKERTVFFDGKGWSVEPYERVIAFKEIEQEKKNEQH